MQTTVKKASGFTIAQKKRIAAILTDNMMPRDGWKLDWQLISDRVIEKEGILHFYFTDGGSWPIDREQFLQIKARHDAKLEQQKRVKGDTKEVAREEVQKPVKVDERFIGGSDKQIKWAIDTIRNLQARSDRDYFLRTRTSKVNGRVPKWEELSDREQEVYNEYVEIWNTIASHPNRKAAKYWIAGYGQYLPLRSHDTETIDSYIYGGLPRMVKARAIVYQTFDKRKQSDRASS